MSKSWRKILGDDLPFNEKPFRVSAQWILFAHGPGADSLYSMASELCGMIKERDYILVPLNRSDLVMEIVGVAELYSGGYQMDADDRKTAATAKRLIKRAKKWLHPNPH